MQGSSGLSVSVLIGLAAVTSRGPEVYSRRHMDTPSSPSSLDLVGSLLDEFLAGEEVGEEAFERFVARHPEHAGELRGLRAAWAGVLAALPSERDEGEPWGGVVPEAGTM